MSGAFIDFQTESVAMDYSEFAPRLYNLCKQFGLRREHMRLACAFCSDEDQGYPLLILTKHFGTFPIDIGTASGRINYPEIPEEHDTDLVIVQASHVGYTPRSKGYEYRQKFDHTFRKLVKEKKYQDKNLIYIAGVHLYVVHNAKRAFTPTLFVPWAAYIQQRDGTHTVLEQPVLVEQLSRCPSDNTEKINLEIALQEMERRGHLLVVDSDIAGH